MAWAKKFTIVVVIIIAICSAQPAPITSAQGDGGTTHIVQSGENLFRIALRYNTTVDAIAVANGITDPTRVYAGQVLIIPAPGTVTTAPVEPTPVTETTYIPPLDNTVPVVAVSNTTPAYHTVQAGETLASIGRLYGLSWTDIATANNIVNANTIYVGQQLTIPGTSGTVAAAPAVTTDPAPAVVQPVATGTEQTHTVQAGESLASIGRIYGLSWPTIAQANNITDPNHIYSGQVLAIPASDLGQGGYTQTNTWTPTTAASPTISTGKQVVVDLSDQTTYAYENGQLLRTVVVSTGLWYAPTVQGDYNVYLKYSSQTMSGPGYYLPGVPYVMYFYQGYSLHGTYWHSNFGQPMSHGCVNMPTPEAEWFYNWTEIGTPVHVQW